MFGSRRGSLAGIAPATPLTPYVSSPSEAREILSRSGVRYPKNSPEEVRALRIIMEGGPISEC